MARRSTVLIPVIIAAVAVGGLGMAFIPQDIKGKDIGFSKGTARIDDNVITIEIAETVAEKQRWLTFRQDRLPPDTAMLIKYTEPDLHEIWTLNIEYNVDLIWFDAQGNAVYLKEDVPPCPNMLDKVGCTYKPTSQTLYVMAATAGFIDGHDIAVGSKMTLISA